VLLTVHRFRQNINRPNYRELAQLSHSNLLNRATPQTIEASREKGADRLELSTTLGQIRSGRTSSTRR